MKVGCGMVQRADKIIDAPDIFCDGVLAIAFRQDVLRLTLHADRIDAEDGKTVNRVVIGHLSMPPGGVVELYNQMTAVVQRRQVEKPPQQPSNWLVGFESMRKRVSSRRSQRLGNECGFALNGRAVGRGSESFLAASGMSIGRGEKSAGNFPRG
jgi:hypothetical protein